ncbi:2Fe-2S iron-sulfur cluster binding domain-containing protein [Rhizobium laguerreae]|nr:2Fe-2S iron-sulfur cluster binding domain-containing protein [Rhizobium laguerreae]
MGPKSRRAAASRRSAARILALVRHSSRLRFPSACRDPGCGRCRASVTQLNANRKVSEKEPREKRGAVREIYRRGPRKRNDAWPGLLTLGGLACSLTGRI